MTTLSVSSLQFLKTIGLEDQNQDGIISLSENPQASSLAFAIADIIHDSQTNEAGEPLISEADVLSLKTSFEALEQSTIADILGDPLTSENQERLRGLAIFQSLEEVQARWASRQQCFSWFSTIDLMSLGMLDCNVGNYKNLYDLKRSGRSESLHLIDVITSAIAFAYPQGTGHPNEDQCIKERQSDLCDVSANLAQFMGQDRAVVIGPQVVEALQEGIRTIITQ